MSGRPNIRIGAYLFDELFNSSSNAGCRFDGARAVLLVWAAGTYEVSVAWRELW
jgi:hypothetical protein